MVEWTREVGERRIKRKFCLFPTYCQQETYVWLGFRYEFCQYVNHNFSNRPYWQTEATLSPKQYKTFCEDVAIHLTDPNVIYREYAKIILGRR